MTNDGSYRIKLEYTSFRAARATSRSDLAALRRALDARRGQNRGAVMTDEGAMTYNPACRLRLRRVRCRVGSPCAGFKPEFFGAKGMVLSMGGVCRLVYGFDLESEAA